MIPLLLLLFCVQGAVVANTQSHEDSSGDHSPTHRRLFGIRRLRLLRPVPAGGPISPSVSKVFRRQQSHAVVPTAFRYAVPHAELPPVYEVVPRHQATQILPSDEVHRESFSHRISNSAETEDARIKRMEARWKKLGINFNKIPFPLGRSKRPSNSMPSTSSSNSEQDERIPSVVRPHRFASNEHSEERIINRSSDSDNEEKDVVGVARVSPRKAVPNHPNRSSDEKPPSHRRPRINGPLLRSISDEESEDDFSFGKGFGSGHGKPPSHGGFGVVPRSGGGFDSDSGAGFGTGFGSFGSAPSPPPTPRETPLLYPSMEAAPPGPHGSYHSRATPTYKHFKFSEKLAQRPRLRIRRPGDGPPKTAGTRNTNIEDLPHLTPFMNQARQKFGYDKQEYPQRFINPETYATKTEPVIIPRTMPAVPPTSTTARTTTEEEVSSEDSGASFGGGSLSGPSELPPEFANVGFGIGGDNGLNFNVPAPEKKEEPKPKPAPVPPKRPRQRKPPTNVDKDEQLVIPQNSGLRPVAPPKELLGSGSFGSGSGGSPFGSFGGGGGGFGGGGGGFGGGGGGFGGGGARPAPPPEPEAKEEDLFTGDSALTPSKGPTGDGYGPPLPEGAAVPPAVPSVNMGGSAAGIPPPESSYRRPSFETTENPPTTVKPSALLNVLNRADQGFNQAITHFEQGSPVETAAIDILEVALGSQKLDSQAKLLGHVDRTFGLDNLQRLQRWANTAGALDMLKEQVVKIAKNYQPPEDLLPTVPPQLEYLFKTGG